MNSCGGQSLPGNIDQTLQLLGEQDYIAERSLATTLYLALKMQKPLFLEGEAGVGKTEIAKVLAQALGRQLIRLQCYEGLDVSSAVYEWNYPRQMLEIRLAEAAAGSRARGADAGPDASADAGAVAGSDPSRGSRKESARNHKSIDKQALARDLFAADFLIERPLLQALRTSTAGPPVLLIDELDRTDEPFEAFLLEILSDFQITIPEIGTIKAEQPPLVIITSNRTREIHDALKRRCLYHWVDYPDAERELAIVNRKMPGIASQLSAELVSFVQLLREQDLFKQPGIAETLDWAEALVQLDKVVLAPALINDTLGALLKYQDDIALIRGSEAARLLQQARQQLAGARVASA